MAKAPDPHCVLRGHAAEVTAAHFGPPDGAGQPLLYSAAADGELCVWSLRTHRPVVSTVAHAGSSVLALHSLGADRLLSQGRDGFMRVWDVHDGLRGPLIELPAQGCLTSLANETTARTQGSRQCQPSPWSLSSIQASQPCRRKAITSAAALQRPRLQRRSGRATAAARAAPRRRSSRCRT